MNYFNILLKRNLPAGKAICKAFCFSILFLGILQKVSALTFTVTSTGDTHAVSPTTSALDGSGQVTLRSAVEAATQIGGSHTIIIPAGNYTLTLGQITLGNSGAGNNITIQGAGKASTTITQTTVNRVFSTGLGAVTIFISDLSINYSGPAGTISGGGGAIVSGGVGASTTLTNVAISNFNIQIGNGGALLCSASSGTNNLTLTNCDFTNNYAGGGGGAVSYNGLSTCVISNCKFTNNKTGPLGANTGGSGGALSTTGSGNGGTYTVTGCTFSGNQVLNASAQGGAIINNNGALTATYCRFINNSAATPSNGNTIAQIGGGTVQTTNSNNNWWGANAPGVNDNVVLAAGGFITCTKWLQLKTSISPASICSGGTATVTASFLTNSASEAISASNLGTIIGLPVSFNNVQLGSISGSQPTIQAAGTATATYTAGGTGGAGSVNSIVDNVPINDATAKGSVTVNASSVSAPTVTQPTCAVPSGTIIVNASGSGVLEYSVNGGGSYQSSATFSGLASGTYNIVVRVQGAPSCTSSYGGNPIQILGSPLTREINVTGNSITIADGDATPSLTDHTDFGSVATGGNFARTYTIQNTGTTSLTILPNGVTTTGADAAMFTVGGISLPTSVAGGTSITFTVTFAPTSSGLKSTTVHVLSDDCDEFDYDFAIQGTGSSCAVSGSGTTTPTSCAGGSNGTATITLTGAGSGAPGTYTVDGGSVQSYTINPFTITGLAAGNHTIVATVTAGGCVSSPIVVNVGSAATFTATYTKTNLSSCSGSPDGTITVNASGGTAPYTYTWTGVIGSGNPATTPFPDPGNVSALTGLNYGFYNVVVTDAGGCGSVTLSNIHVEFAYAVYITNSGSASSSCGNTGSVILYGNAGVTPYTYSLTAASGPYQVSNTFNNLAAGSYTAYVKDAAGCVSTKPVTVAAAPAIVVSPFARAASSCAPDGAIEVYRTGGIPPYTYSKDGTTYQSGNIFTNLAAGSYTVYVKDSKGCIGQANTTVGAGQGLTVTTSKVNTSTCVNDGTIQVNATGGIAPYTYSINGGAYQPGNTFTGLGSATYVISVKDTKGCLGSANATINYNTINVTAQLNNASSCAAANGSIQLYRTGGTGPYSYSLDGNTYQASNSFTGLTAGVYTGFVKDSKACVGMITNLELNPDCNPCRSCKGSSAGNNVARGASIDVALKVEAFPNPSNSSFNLVLQGFSSEKVQITVTDVLGRIVYQSERTGIKQLKIGESFKPGIYHIQVVQGSNKQSIKIVKE